MVNANKTCHSAYVHGGFCHHATKKWSAAVQHHLCACGMQGTCASTELVLCMLLAAPVKLT